MNELFETNIRESTHKPPLKKISKNEQLNQSVFNSLTAQIAVLNAEGVIQTVNESWELFEKEYSFTALPAIDCVGMNYIEICKSPGGRFSKESFEAASGIHEVLKGALPFFTLEYSCVLCSIHRWFLMSVTLLHDSQGAIVSHTDITEMKAMRKMKDEFVNVVSHELKTPLTSLKGIVHILQLSFLKKIRGEGARLLKTMDAQLDKLARIIGDLLDIYTIPGHQLQLSSEEFDFKNLITETVENIRNISPLHFLSVNRNESIVYRGDRSKLEQVITNLLTNAVKYSPQSNQVLINSIIKDNSILVSVRDFGIGVDEENFTMIFERFYRINNGPGVGGLGLGLHISAEIIKAHKGNLWVESHAGEGSTFYFSLPLDKE